jgi:hypothetical protein
LRDWGFFSFTCISVGLYSSTIGNFSNIIPSALSVYFSIFIDFPGTLFMIPFLVIGLVCTFCRYCGSGSGIFGFCQEVYSSDHFHFIN